MKKILLITLDITLMGGVERSNNNLAKLFDSKGHPVTIISFFRSSEKPYFNFGDIDLVYLSNKPIGYGLISKFFTLIYFFKLLTYLSNVKDNLVILSCFPRITLLLSFFFSFPKKVIACEHSSFHIHNKLTQNLRIIFYKRLGCVVTLTEHDQHIFSKAGLDTFKIPNFTDFNKDIKPRTDKFLNSLVCISVGRLHPHKGFDRLLEIAKDLITENIKFIIVGSGSEEKRIRHLIDIYNLNSLVTLMPASNNLELLMSSADVLLMTSLTEAAPMVILEAFSYSKPVIAYDCPVGPREIISNNINGFLVNDGDKSQFVNKLKQILGSHILYNYLAENAGTYAKHNSSEHNYKLWSKLFNSRLS